MLSERCWLITQLGHHRRVSVSLTVRTSSPQHDLVQTSLEILALSLQCLYGGGQTDGQQCYYSPQTSHCVLTCGSSLYPARCPRTASGCVSRCPPWRPPAARRLSSGFHSCPGGPRLAWLNTEKDKISGPVGPAWSQIFPVRLSKAGKRDRPE